MLLFQKKNVVDRERQRMKCKRTWNPPKTEFHCNKGKVKEKYKL